MPIVALNPTHGSGWIVQIRLQMLRVRGKGAGLELSTHYSGWDFRRIDRYSHGRLDLKLSTHCRGWDSEFSHNLIASRETNLGGKAETQVAHDFCGKAGRIGENNFKIARGSKF